MTAMVRVTMLDRLFTPPPSLTWKLATRPTVLGLSEVFWNVTASRAASIWARVAPLPVRSWWRR